MRNSLPACFLVLAFVGCVAQQPPPPTTAATAPAQAVTPTTYAAGSAQNTTTAFDGTYTFTSVQNISRGGGSLRPEGEGFKCPDYTASHITISGGLAQFDVRNTILFQGYVTPQGILTMRTGVGQQFDGQIDPQGMIHGRVTGGCAYEATWHRSA